MTQPTVCAVMLVNGREAMARRAIKSFHDQTYHAKRLLLWDTTPGLICCDQTEDAGVFHVPAQERETIGALRNDAAAFWNDFPILIHWDSDDWSHPNRIAEQVALLQSSGRQCVGYRDMLFWKQTALRSYASTHPDDCECGTCGPGQRAVVVGEHDLGSAWLYSHAQQCLGTSLCYWRSVWEQRPFPDLPKKRGGVGEDVEWLRGVDSLGESSLTGIELSRPIDEPRMIASIHGGNTQLYDPAEYVARERGTSWKRASEWDDYCRSHLQL